MAARAQAMQLASEGRYGEVLAAAEEYIDPALNAVSSSAGRVEAGDLAIAPAVPEPAMFGAISAIVGAAGMWRRR